MQLCAQCLVGAVSRYFGAELTPSFTSVVASTPTRLLPMYLISLTFDRVTLCAYVVRECAI